MLTLLGIVHGLDFLLSCLLVGQILFFSLVLPSGGESAKSSFYFSKLHTLAALAFLSSTVWMILTAANMSGSWAAADLWAAVSSTSFGHLWCLRILVLALLALIWPRLRSGSAWVLVPLFGVLLISSLTGHAAAGEHSTFLPVAIDWIHSVVVAAWAGGLLSLYQWLGARVSSLNSNSNLSIKVVTRFSHLAMISTAVIFGTGILMAYTNGVSFRHPWDSEYGTKALLKVGLFSAALGAAAVNQFVHLRSAKETEERKFALSIRREIRIEIALVLFVFLVAGFLTMTELPSPT
jgi:putative copper export protein